jgi:hypothetical protein
MFFLAIQSADEDDKRPIPTQPDRMNPPAINLGNTLLPPRRGH